MSAALAVPASASAWRDASPSPSPTASLAPFPSKPPSVSSAPMTVEASLATWAARRRVLWQRRASLSLLGTPRAIARYFGSYLLHVFRTRILARLRRHGLHLALLLVAVGGLVAATLAVDGPHVRPLQRVYSAVLWYAYWTLLGVMSSIGLGTGLHTFVLFLAPHIATTTVTAYACGTTAFPTRGENAFVCPSAVVAVAAPVTLYQILLKVRWEAFWWGTGTALGELPPYFVARTAALAAMSPRTPSTAVAGTGMPTLPSAPAAPVKIVKDLPMPPAVVASTSPAPSPSPSPDQGEAFETALRVAGIDTNAPTLALLGSDAMGESGASLDGAAAPGELVQIGLLLERPWSQLTYGERLQVTMYHMMQRLGFWGILLCASIPNPLFDLAGIMCGHFLVPFSTFFGATFIGKAIVKTSIQSVFVALVLSEEVKELALPWLAHHAPQLHRWISPFLDKQLHKMSQSSRLTGAAAAATAADPAAATAAATAAIGDNPFSLGALVGLAWNTFLGGTILYFVLKTVEALARGEAERRDTVTLRRDLKQLRHALAQQPAMPLPPAASQTGAPVAAAAAAAPSSPSLRKRL